VELNLEPKGPLIHKNCQIQTKETRENYSGGEVRFWNKKEKEKGRVGPVGKPRCEIEKAV